MELIDQLSNLASRAQKQLAHIQTEKGYKNSIGNAIYQCARL